MNEEKIVSGLKSGKGSRQIARELGISRQEVEIVARRRIFDRQRTRHTRIKWSVVMLVIWSALVMLVYLAFREPTDLEMHTNVLRCADSLRVTPDAAPWFIEESQPMQDFSKLVSVTDNLTKKLAHALDQNADIQEVAELRKMFGGKMVPAIFDARMGTSMQIGDGANALEMLEKQRDPGNLEVVFFGHQAYRHPKIRQRLLFFDPDWHSLFMGALNYTDERWFAAIVAHELWHAKLARGGVASATAPMLSDLWIKEELQAHEVERKVLNGRTGGRYDQRLGEIVAKTRARSLRHFFDRVQPAEVRSLDELFRPGLEEERGHRAAQYLFNLVWTWVAENYQGTELEAKKIEAYRLLVSPQSTGVR